MKAIPTCTKNIMFYFCRKVEYSWTFVEKWSFPQNHSRGLHSKLEMSHVGIPLGLPDCVSPWEYQWQRWRFNRRHSLPFAIDDRDCDRFWQQLHFGLFLLFPPSVLRINDWTGSPWGTDGQPSTTAILQPIAWNQELCVHHHLATKQPNLSLRPIYRSTGWFPS